MQLNWRTGTALAGALSLLSGCVSLRPTMTSFSVDYNRVVADTRDRMILLNIVRAAYREPTYYTAFQSIEGSLNLQGSVSGTIANLAGGDATAFTPTVNGSITNAPTFTIVPLSDDEFAKGMLQPVGPDTIALFLSQGWRSRLLAPLLVQKVECIYDGEVVAEIRNAPDSANEAAMLPKFADIRFSTTKAEPATAYRLTVKTADLFQAITGGALDKLDIAQQGTSGDQSATTIEVRQPAGRQLEARGADLFKDECKARFDHDANGQPAERARFALTSAQVQGLDVGHTLEVSGAHPAAVSHGQMTLNVVFRSTDELVYYLGERVRAQIKGQPIAKPDADGNILFTLDRNASGPVAVAVAHRNQRWSIPAIEIGQEAHNDQGKPIIDRSLEVLALINQLIAAQTSLKEFSRAPASVRVR